jgi:hypothetical protein
MFCNRVGDTLHTQREKRGQREKREESKERESVRN